MERLDKVRFTEKISEVFEISEDLKIWDYYWFVDEEESVLYMTKDVWENHTQAAQAEFTNIRLTPTYYNIDSVYTYVSIIDGDNIAYVMSLFNDKNIGTSLRS